MCRCLRQRAVCGGGGDGTILTSADGVNWTNRSSGTTDDLYGIAYGSGHYVAVGYSAVGWGSIFTSADGIDWTNSIWEGTLWPLYGAVYGTYANGEFVAVGQGGNILSSADGATWTEFGVGAYPRLQAVAHGGGQFVAVGTYGAILTSPDGATWTSHDLGSDAALFGVAYGNGQFVAVGAGGVVLTSPDGVTWTSRDSGLGSTPLGVLYGVGYANGEFVAVGFGQSDAPACIPMIATSGDGGATWTTRDPGPAYAPSAIAYGNGRFVVVGGSGHGLIAQSGIVPPMQPTIGVVALPASGVAQISLSGEPGQTYAIQASTNLTDWTTITNLTLAGSSGAFEDLLGPSGYRRFYRAMAH